MPNFEEQLKNLKQQREQVLAHLHQLDGAIAITESNLLEQQTENKQQNEKQEYNEEYPEGERG